MGRPGGDQVLAAASANPLAADVEGSMKRWAGHKARSANNGLGNGESVRSGRRNQRVARPPVVGGQSEDVGGVGVAQSGAGGGARDAGRETHVAG